MNITTVVELKPNPHIPALAPGDIVKVRSKVVEGEKVRTQTYQGVVIRVRHGGAGASFTVRRISYGVGVERTFPIYSPLVEGVDLVRHGRVRRARLYYLRGLSAKASRIKERRVVEKEELVPVEGEAQPEEPVVEAQAAVTEQGAAEQPKAEAKEQPVAAAAEATKAEAKEEPKAAVAEKPKSEVKAQPQAQPAEAAKPAKAKKKKAAKEGPKAQAEVKEPPAAQSAEPAKPEEKAPEKG